MDEGSQNRFLDAIKGLFKKSDIEDHIMDAKVDGELDSQEVSMILNVLKLDDRLVHEIMIPRTDIVCSEVDASLDEIARLFIESGHSRIPVFEGNRDSIVGIVHAKALLRPMLQNTAEGTTISDIMRKPFFISENTNISELLKQFQTKRIHMAVALDEYGGTSGIVTIEDVLEEIVGDIQDEYDQKRPQDIMKLEDGRYQVSGRTSLEDLSDNLDIDISSDQVETIGGYLAEITGRIPKQGELFTLDGFKLTVDEADPRSVHSIIMERTEKEHRQ